MELFLISIIIYLVGGIVQGFVPSRLKAVIFSLFSAISSALLAFLSLRVILTGISLTATLILPFPWKNIPCTIDALSAFFILIIAVVGFLVVLYSSGYLKAYIDKENFSGSHLFFFSLLIVFMLLVTVLRNALAFLIAWEIMSLASFFLVAFENEKKEVYDAAIHYLIAMHIGVIFLMSAFLILYIKTGSLEFSAFAEYLKAGGAGETLVPLLFIFFFIGFGTKAGFVPFHAWLPQAHPAAPAHISGIMSAVMIKTGLYGIMRVISMIGPSHYGLGYFVLGVSLITALLGIMYASGQRDVKRFLAYSSIENIGIMGIGIGMGMLGLAYRSPVIAYLAFGGSLLHIFNHSIFKSLLFFGSGVVYQHTHSRDMEKMGGLIKEMPATAYFTLAGSIAICALPPFNGFISEFLLYFAMVKGILLPNALVKTASIFSIAGLAFVGATALIAFTKMFSIVFLGAPREQAHATHHNQQISPLMKYVMGFLALEALLIGLFPQFVLRFLEYPMRNLGVQSWFFPAPAAYTSMLSDISRAFFIFLIFAILIYGIRKLLLKNKSVTEHSTWGCGYQAPTPRMQYTGTSYARLFLMLIKPFTNTKLYIKFNDVLFPKEGRIKSNFSDIFEKYIINPISCSIHSSVGLFSWIQRGSTQQYIFYGLLFLMVAILWILGTS